MYPVLDTIKMLKFQIIPSLRNLSYEERLKSLGMFSLRRGWYDDGIDKVNLGKLFLTDVVVSYKGLNTFKIKLYEFMTGKGKI